MGDLDINTIFYVLVIARWIHFTSMFALFGGASFWFYIDPKHRLGLGLDGLPWTVEMTTHILQVAGPTAALAGIAWLVASIANMTGDITGIVDPETLHAFFFETPFGLIAITRLILLSAVVAATVLPMQPFHRFLATAVLSALLLVSQAWLGHAAEGGETVYGAVMIAAYAAHVLAAAAWVGGLPPLLLALLEQRRRCDSRALVLRRLLHYSAVAFAAVIVIVASGLANTAFRIGWAPLSLLATDYGKVLVTKVALVALMLVFAAFHRFAMVPRVGTVAESPRSLFSLRGSIALEVALGILVLGAAAVLGITPPPS